MRILLWATQGYLGFGGSGESGSGGTDPPPLVEVNVEHSQIEVVDYVDHALRRLPAQFRGDT